MGRWALIAAIACGAIGASCHDQGTVTHDAAVEASVIRVVDASGGTQHAAYADASLSASNDVYGPIYSGGEYSLGPVDWDETHFHNACASEQKYLPLVREAEGQLLAGVWNGLPHPQSYCDACIRVVTDRGKSAVLRVVTYGTTSVNSLDLSPEAYALLDSGEFPRTMRWQVSACPSAGPLLYEFKTGSNAYWTGFWVRNARLPIASVETVSLRHVYAGTSRDTDGSFVDPLGLGTGTFSIRVTTLDGQQIVDTFTPPASGIAGSLLVGSRNF